jgi:peptidyl-tRNA hydrolase, PTH1 family
MKIVVFLGNIGKKYEKNRHNTGFIIGNNFAEKFNISVKKKEFHSLTGISKINNSEVLLIFPQTLMNNSGLAANAAMSFYNEKPENIIVIHDEIELPFGEIKIKFSGGHKGHNGIRSIIQHTGSSDFYRVRVGVGRPLIPEMKVANYLLSDFSSEEINYLKQSIPHIIDEIIKLINK